MSNEKNPLGFQPLPAAQGRGLRETSGPAGLTIGYDPGLGNGPQPFPGDQDFPFVMVPPDITEPQPLRRAKGLQATESGGLYGGTNPLPPATSAETLAAIDVRGQRHLTLFLTFYPGFQLASTLVSVLALLPQASPSLVTPSASDPLAATADWYPVGVVDPTLRGMQPSVDGWTSVHPADFAFRNTYASQLNVPGNVFNNTGLPHDAVVKAMIVFDVAPFALFRMQVGMTNPNAGGVTPPVLPYAVPTNANLDMSYLLQR